MIGIYSITSPSLRVYIGQSWQIEKRWREYGKPSTVKRQPYICASINKYGLQSHTFRVVHELPSSTTQATLDFWERLYMSAYSAQGIPLMNIRGGGSRGRLAQETKDKIGAKHRGRKTAEDVKLRMSLARRGVKKSESHKRNIGRANLGRQSFIEAFRGERNLKAKLSPEQVAEIRRRHVPYQKKCNKNLAIEFGVSVSTVERITGRGKGGTWLHL